MLKAIDLYCGAGGTTCGAEMSGCVKVVVAINHWKAAIYTHQDNHPETRHIHAPIDSVDPREFAGEGIQLIFASPECTHHSIARGGRPVEDQKRAGGWDVLKWVEALRPRWLVVENVREWMDWGPVGTNGRPLASKKGHTFHAWLTALQSLGYRVEWRLLNAADYGAHTNRVRLFVIARKGNRSIPWPDPTHDGNHRAAAEIIDWELPCPSIFTRKRPLVDKTLRRIEKGIRRFCRPFVVQFDNHRSDYGRVHSIFEPLRTQTTKQNRASAIPFLLPRVGFYDRHRDHVRSINRPLPTILATHSPCHVVQPWSYDGCRGAWMLWAMRHAGCSPAMHSLLTTMWDHGVVDVGFRMLTIDELMLAQGFPQGYSLFGSKTDQTRMIGNSVVPQVACAISRAIAAA